MTKTLEKMLSIGRIDCERRFTRRSRRRQVSRQFFCGDDQQAMLRLPVAAPALASLPGAMPLGPGIVITAPPASRRWKSRP